MPLPAALAERLRGDVLDRLPPRELTGVSPMGATARLFGYLTPSTGPLDALGLPDHQARLHLAPDEPTVNPGDEIDDAWVAWTPELQIGAWRRIDLRRLPNFTTWTRERATAGARDPVTRAPLLTTATAALDAYLWRAGVAGRIEEATERDATSAVLIVRGPHTAAALGDVLTHPEHGRYRIAGSSPYGPWSTAKAEAF